MLKKIPLRFRLTLINVLLLLACCLLLTLGLNLSAYRMVNVIEAVPIIPATSFEPFEEITMNSTPLTATATKAKKIYSSQSIVWMAAIVTIGGVLTWLMTGRALFPLKDLSRQMRNRTVHNLAEVLPIPASRDEVASLTGSFNEMSQSLDAAFEMQKRFSQSAAHELRTPLTIVKTKLDVFRKHQVHTQADYEALLSLIELQTCRLSSLVKDLLELANLDDMVCEEEIFLQDLLSDIIAELSVLAKEQQVTLSFYGLNLKIEGNQNLIYRAFYNLIENAIKYNRPNGFVEVSIKQQDKQPVVTISDTGIGISKEHYSLIFEPFYRVDKSRSRSMGGAGLGLAMVKSILDKHHAELILSERPGGGSSFTVRFLYLS